MPERTRGWGIASRILLAIAVVGSALAAGAVHTLTICIATLLLAFATVGAWLGAQPLRARSASTVLLFVGLGLTIYTAFQALPLPAGLVAFLAPTNAAVWRGSLEPLGLPAPTSFAISLDPTATQIEVLKGVAYLCAFLTALRICHRREGARGLELLLIASSAIVAVGAIIHPALNAERLFGVYRPDSEFGRHLAPILNPNHLAGYLNIGFCLALAMALQPKVPVPRVVVGAVALFLMATQIWIASRGGVIAMIAGGLFVGWFTHLSRSPTTPRSSRTGKATLGSVTPVLVAVGGVCMAVLAASEEAWTELSLSSLSKLQLTSESLRMAPSFGLFGAGRGTFESAFPPFRHDAAYVSYSHPENILAQWFVEWGFVVSLLAGAAILFALRPSAQARPHALAGPWAAVIATFLHNLVDFNSELASVGIAMSVCVAIIVGGPRSDRGRRLDGWSLRPNVVAITAALVGVVTVGVALSRRGTELFEERLAFADKLGTKARDPGEFRARIEAAMRRHPGEAYFPYAGAEQALRAREDVLPWVSRALERFPAHGPAHLVLARYLRVRAPSQSLLEYRLSLETTGNVDNVVNEAIPLLDSQEAVLHFADIPVLREETLNSLAAAVRATLPATSEMLDEQLVKLRPDLQKPLLRAAEAALRDVEPATRETWCIDDAEDCLRRASDLIQRIRTGAPRRCESYELAARLALAGGKPSDAISILSGAVDVVDDRQQCLRALVSLALDTNSRPWVDDGLDRLARSGCAGPEECADLYVFVARSEDRRGNARRALAMYKKAHDAWPENAGILATVAQRASALGMHNDAISALNEASRHGGTDAEREQMIAREKAAIEADRMRESLKVNPE